MTSSDRQKAYFGSWQVAKILCWAHILANIFFGIPLVALVLFAANVPLLIIWQAIIFYVSVVLFIYIPFNWFLSFSLLSPARKLLDKIYKKERVEAGENLSEIGKILNMPTYFSFITFFTSFLGFVLALFVLRSGLITELAVLVGDVIFLGLTVGLATCIIQAFLVYIFLENYFRIQMEKLPPFYFKTTKAMKIRKTPLSWKIFFLSLFSVIVVQMSLGSLYLGRIIIHSPEDIKIVLIYISIVMVLNLIYIIIVTVFFSRNLVAPLKKIIVWADKITKGEIKEEISIVTNDETLELIEYLKKMHEELENTKASLEIKIKARTKQLEEINEQQEEIIQERIKEIQKRAEELERFQRLAVGRELKMVELKKEIKALEEKLKKLEE